MKELVDKIFRDKLSISRKNYDERCKSLNLSVNYLITKGFCKRILKGSHIEREHWNEGMLVSKEMIQWLQNKRLVVNL